jgi:DNA (cytosine-5)-methyltransferase 1
MNGRPRLLDLFCGAGGAAMGYHRAGFDVIGVDINPQNNYPFEFHQADAMTFPLDGYDMVHASPPCQEYSVTRSLHDVAYPRLVAPTRERLREVGLPFVIENVVGADLIEPVTLCGSMFGLGVRRHRRFEVSGGLIMRPKCRHDLQPEPLDVTGGGPTKPGRTRTTGGVSRKPRNVREAGDAMGIGWMTRDELNEAIPPAYTQFLGEQLLSVLSLGETV